MTVTPDQGRMIATLACESRPTGARRWKPDKVLAEIQKLHDRSLPSVICAVTRCAMDRNIQREEAISSAGSHWSDTQIVTPLTEHVTRQDRCSVCSLPKNACRLKWRHDHEFDSMADAAKRKAARRPDDITATVAGLKDMLAPTVEPDTRKGLEDMAERNPKLRERVDAIRAALPPVAPLRESEPEVEMEAAE